MKIALVVGARPNFPKAAALVPALEAVGIEVHLIHTGQHSSDSMSGAMFRDLGLRQPDITLPGVDMPTTGSRLGAITSCLSVVFDQLHPNLVMVVGDCDSTLAGALAAKKLGIKLVHVEAGLRSFDPRMQEEFNRRSVDAASDLLFASESAAVGNLRREQMTGQVHLVGNVMIDTLHRTLPQTDCRTVFENSYAVLTLHRAENVDYDLEKALTAIRPVVEKMPVVFPVHPRTRKKWNERLEAIANLRLTEPLGYLGFVKLVRYANVVLTDSGGVQEETTALGVPCLTLRESTERPSTILYGTNRLVSTNPSLVAAALLQINAGGWPNKRGPDNWDGHAAERIRDILVEWSYGKS